MYKVFCESRSVTLQKEVSHNIMPGAVPGSFQVTGMVHRWLNGDLQSDLIFKSEETPFGFFSQHVPAMKLVEAAGGVVMNQHDEVLFIYRNQFWDLPKGHVDPGENHLETALREVTEETGLSGLHSGQQLPDTWHCYFFKGKWVMKHTCWFRMTYNGNEIPVPQFSEGITAAEWIGRAKLPEILGKSYRSVQDVLGRLIVSKL